MDRCVRVRFAVARHGKVNFTLPEFLNAEIRITSKKMGHPNFNFVNIGIFSSEKYNVFKKIKG